MCIAIEVLYILVITNAKQNVIIQLANLDLVHILPIFPLYDMFISRIYTRLWNGALSNGLVRVH